MGIALVPIRGKRSGQRRPPVHAVVVHEQEMAIVQPKQIDGRIWIRKRGIRAGTPGPTAVLRFGAYQVAVCPWLVVAAAAAVADQMAVAEGGNRRLKIAQPGMDPVAFCPST